MITLVCGPPCVGKSTYVHEHAQPHDLIVDFDDIAVDLGSPTTHQHAYPIARAAGQRYDQLIAEIEAGQHPNAWVIRCAADRRHRERLAARIGADDTVILTLDRATLHARAARRPNPPKARRDIDRWLATYRP